MSYLSDAQYNDFLEERIRSLEDPMAHAPIRKKLELWRRQYQVERLIGRAAELLDAGEVRPNLLYLRCETDLQLLGWLVQRHRFDPNSFRGFLAADELRNLCRPESFSPFPVHWVSEWRDEQDAVVLTLSDERPFRNNGRDRGNDYLTRFIDLDRFETFRETVNADADKIIVLYPMYREIHTVSILARCVGRMDERLRSVSLTPSPVLDADFDVSLVEPFFYLWPLIFHTIDPSIVHLNVGWGIQALPFSPFLPDRRRTVVDFYEVLSFVPDVFFERTHSNAEQVRLAEAHFFRDYDHIMTMASPEACHKLRQKYGHKGSIASVIEYLQEPTYHCPPRNDGEIRLVYGGAMLARNSPTDFYYHPFLNAVRHYTRENLRLYIYTSPYLNGLGENDGLKEVIRSHGLTHVHVCQPLRLKEFTRQIAEYDYGTFLMTTRDFNVPGSYDYLMATKVLVYLQAGLPVLVDAGYRYVADLVEKYDIGIVLYEGDLERLPEILNQADLARLKRNVQTFRSEFHMDKAGVKVLKLYHEILEQGSLSTMRSITSRRRSAPARRSACHEENRAAGAGDETTGDASFANMIEVMARRENRLYYRDQSARTMSSLAALARQTDPSVIVELGTLGGLSLRTWIASTQQARIYAVDLSFQTLRETLEFLPADLSRVTLLEQDILKMDFARLWTAQDRVIFFVDAHDLPNVPIMEHVLGTALPSVPDGSLVVIDDLWFSEERLTPDNARGFLEDCVLDEIDELQCFHGHFAPYHEGGSFMGFAEVVPLLDFVNEHGIPLIHDRGGKHAFFVWKKAYLSQHREPVEGCRPSDGTYGSVQYNPLESVPVGSRHEETMRRIALQYLQKDIRGAAESLADALAQDPRDQGLSYSLAVCLARGGMLSQARDVLARHLSDSSHPRYRRLFEDLARRVGPPEPREASVRPPEQTRDASARCGLTIFAMPKAFTGHTAVIQKNAIRSWARLDPAPQIILFGDEPGIREMAEEIGARHIADVDRNEFGTPLVDKLFESAQDHASHPVLAYVNADVILTPDFAQAVQKVQSELPNFLLIGRRWDLVLLDEIDFAAPQWQESLSRQLAERGILHAECGLDYFVFRRGLWPQIPPFAIGRTAWDNWLVLDPQRRGIPVVDGTEFITAIHQDHDYAHLRGRRQEAWKGQEAVRNRALAGAIDDSAYSSGATWALNKDGHLAQVSPRQSGFSTAAQRTRRVAWLMRQAEWLTTRGQMELTACKWEETLTLLDKLAGSGGLGDSAGQSLDDARAAECYKTACVSLAECYRKLGLAEQVVACYTRLLEASWVAIPHARRDDITRVRDRLLDCLSRNGKPSDRSSGVSEGLPVTSETAGEDRHAAERERRGCRRLALIVSIPERQAGLRSVIGAIEGQVDEIRVLLNEFEAAPQDLYECRKVSVVETSRTGDLYASGVWTLLRPGDEGYVFILDDDIAYPPDYADRMVAKIEEHRRRAVVVVHGMDFCQPFQDYLRDRTIYRFEFARNQDGVVDAGGVGTLAFHTDTIRPQVQDFPNPNFRDLWFAILAARHEVPIVCVARAAHWLRTLDIRGRQLWHMSHRREWQDLKNRVFHEHLLPLLDTREQPGRVRKRDVTIFCFTNGRSTFDYSVQSLVESADQHQQIVLLKDMHFLEAAAKCMDLCTTPYFFKVDDDFLLHPQAVAYMQKRVLEYPHPEGLGIYYCHLWEDWTSRVRESIKVYNVDALRKIGGFKADALGKVDRMTVARLEEAGYKVVGDPSVVAVHACGDWQEQLEYERLWSSMAGTPYRKPTHDAMKRYCGTKSLDEQYAMRLGFLESVNRQLDTPFHRYLIDAAGPDAGASRTGASAARDERVSPRASGPVAGRAAAATKVSKPSSDGGLTVFAMPKAFRGHVSMIQKNAIRSWARLDPAPEIILFGDEPGIREMAEEVGARHIPEVGRNEFGTPLVDRLFEAAQDLASHDVLAYVNADMILLRDFAQAVEKVRTHFPTFLLIGQRWDLPLLEEIDFRDPQWRSRLQGQLEEHAMLHAESGLDYFVFRKGLWPHIPPFAIGRTAWDNWLVMDPRKRGVPVVDGTAYITAVHQDHDYAHVAGGRDEAWYGAEAAKNHSLAGQTDHFGLASGTTWLLGEDGELKETAPRQPQYISADYCDQHSTWLLRQARRLLAAGAKELAACKCQETLVCLDKWLKLRSIGCMPAEPAGHVDIPGRYHVGYTLLAHCQTLMGRHKQAAVTYAQLLENPHVVLTPAQRDQIVQARDRLIRHLADAGQPADSDSSVVCASSPGALCGAEIGRPPKVTVVTVCRNGQRYLKECVESILGQTMADWELLLIDDGSTDGSERLIDDFTRQDARIKPYRFPDNCGPYVRRNFAIRQAASEFIVIHDVDDIMDPVKLERLYQEINRDDALAMVGSYHRTFLDEFHDLEHTEPCELPVDHDAIAACCASWRAGISHGTAIIRKALFDTIGLYDENPFAADTFWSAKLALYAETGAPAKMANLPEYLTLIRIHAGSQTQLLPVFDPRGRRVRYRLYCECKLRRIRENWRAQPRLDVAAELRNCTCADFLTRFKAKIIQWESETLSADFVNDLLAGALSCFRQRAYVSCVSILNGLDVMQRDIVRRVPGFDLLRAMAFHASGLRAQSLIHVRREIENHDSPMAGRFLHDSQEQGPSMDVRSWCLQHGSGLTLRLAGEERRQVRAIPV